MYNNILSRLQSSDKEERLQAIKDLARTEDPAVLKHLSHIYKNDHDPDVRDMALKAGRFIRQKAQEQDAFDSPAPTPAVEYDGPAYEMTDDAASLGELTRKKKKNRPAEPVSAAAEKRASGLLDRAMNMSMSGDSAGAVAALRKAFAINPNLADDDYATTLAGDIMGLPKEDAVEELLYTAEVINSRGGDDGISWNTALADLATYGIVTAIIVFVGSLLVSRLMGDMFSSFLDYALVNSGGSYDEYAAYSQAELELAIDYIRNPSIPGILLFSLTSSLFGIVGLLFWFGILHFAAYNFFSGNGSYRKLIHGVTPFLTILTLVQTVVYGVIFFIMFRTMGDALLAYNGTYDPTIERGLSEAMNWFQLINLLFSLGVTFWYAKLVGDVYEFGTGKGCISIIAGHILIVVFACGCGLIFSTALSGLFAGAAGMVS